jgi:hypothetical protein
MKWENDDCGTPLFVRNSPTLFRGMDAIVRWPEENEPVMVSPNNHNEREPFENEKGMDVATSAPRNGGDSDK